MMIELRMPPRPGSGVARGFGAELVDAEQREEGAAQLEDGEAVVVSVV
jgi:hypothetical protein